MRAVTRTSFLLASQGTYSGSSSGGRDEANKSPLIIDRPPESLDGLGRVGLFHLLLRANVGVGVLGDTGQFEQFRSRVGVR